MNQPEPKVSQGDRKGADQDPTSARILIVDDEPELRRTLARLMAANGLTVLTAASGEEALKIIATESVEVALVDLQMPGISGLDLLAKIESDEIDLAVVIMTAHGDVGTAVNAIHSGAYDFLTKPFRSMDEVVLTVKKAVEHRRLRERNQALEQKLLDLEHFGELIGSSKRMRSVYERAMGVAGTGSTVLISGESGTGKELTAKAIHSHSQRAERRFVAVNCSAIPENLIESELFGHVKGAFTGAASTRQGLFENANGGTLFLDEIGDLPPLAQVKVLRALQEGEVRRVGSDETRHVDVRVIVATNVDLGKRISDGKFRQDLFYRLSVVEIQLPALRERAEDIPLLAYHFLKKHSDATRNDIKRISPEALGELQRRRWEGNVRELENAIQHAIVFCKGNTVETADLPLVHNANDEKSTDNLGMNLGILADLTYRDAKDRALELFERAYFNTILARTSGNVSEAARQAGLDRSNFRRALRRAQSRGDSVPSKELQSSSVPKRLPPASAKSSSPAQTVGRESDTQNLIGS